MVLVYNDLLYYIPIEYDPNRHCGVWVEEEMRHCIHSLTCKVSFSFPIYILVIYEPHTP